MTSPAPCSVAKRQDVGVDIPRGGAGTRGSLVSRRIVGGWAKCWGRYDERVIGPAILPAGDGMLTFRGYRIAPRLAYIALGILASLGVAMLYTFDPRNGNAYPVCPFFGLTGYHCPGCGTLRALTSCLPATSSAHSDITR